MKKKIICIILAAATVAVASIGAAPRAVSLFQNLRDFKKLQSDLKKEQQQHSDANNKLAGKGSQGAANGNDLDSTIITRKMYEQRGWIVWFKEQFCRLLSPVL